MTKTLLLLTLLVFSSNIAYSQIDKILKNDLLKHASVSVSMIEMESGKLVYSQDPNRSLIPASTLKILTGVNALNDLGGDFRYYTEIAYDGEIAADGTLSGNIYVIGSGDPSLGSSRISGNPSWKKLIQLMAKKTKQTITCIDGNIIVVSHDKSNRYPVPQDWLYEDVGNYYGAGIWPLNINENQYQIHFIRSGKVGGKTQVSRIEPRIGGMQHINKVTVGRKGSGDQSYILGGPYQYNRTIVGSLPQGGSTYKIKGAMPDPPSFFADRLAMELSNQGVRFQNVLVSTSLPNPSLKTITKIKSPKLIEIVKSILLESNNLYTEAVSRTLEDQGKKKTAVLGKGSHIVDASGLSPMNRITSLQMATFLKDQGIPSKQILSCLPKAGVNGTLKNMFIKSPAKGKIYAKSGSMGGVLTYAGYINKKGKWYSFSLLFNNFDSKIKEMKPLAEDLMEELFIGAFN